MSIEARFQQSFPGFTLDVDLSLPGRGVTALFGPSGCGKSTLLRCIAGLNAAPSGRCVVNGEVWQDGVQALPTHQRPLGYVFQEPQLFAHLSVSANLMYGRQRAAGAAQQVAWDRAIELLGIAHLLERRTAGLSGGERQRIAIARALLTSPRLLLMDEPLAALDLARKNEFMPYLERLHRELDIPVVYVSHAPDEVARLADHIVAMETGRVLASGPLAEVLSRVDLPIRLGEDTGVVLEGVVVERDAAWSLARVAFPGGCLWVRDGGQAQGATVRIRILARDVSLALSPATDTSLLNSLPVVVDQLADDSHPALALCRLQVGTSSSLLSRLTRRSAAALGLQPGQAVWAQIKAVALIG
ncbi:MAG: molybdenum ABC transporter ATP-binding protein [Gammaproteobacteria bacterium]|uniref:molybdenum ABC transporter ATP-binding protein n=1 Tax=Hydrogenophaga sp. TaxID=1904254 RepID=UPI0025BB05F5|nr:molybdenum ABC transporter ATP-binding protein [Hydrogenophaga sp.]MBU4181864.1 molybdenum ABC transporter ATP-binding protein [Gammaproteobacteria bacterium]MBU4280144.1 molybdenum ABC transporter ATP-binding protein [Gammaproteobacteria bacterium]MBU4324198.1 molybdenum ABC transporter ATP-binding protein [Gammaproteobacteria bacterium]MCG2657449.1 molybdenum ABC transporter ATP-binding protein [Hydrogenophaga sp.]